MIVSQINQLDNGSFFSFENMEIKFQSFHGRMVNLFNPLEDNWISEILTKIATLFASVIVYPLWGAIKVIETGVKSVQACFINTEEMPDINEIKKEERREIKQQILWDLQLWSEAIDLQDLTGNNLKIYFGADAKDFANNEQMDELEPTFINKNPEEIKDFINNSLTYIQDCIDKRDDLSSVDIEFLIIGELETKYDSLTIQYQAFRQSYLGKKCIKRAYIHPDIHSVDSKDRFMETLKNFKLFTVEDEIWNANGSLTY